MKTCFFGLNIVSYITIFYLDATMPVTPCMNEYFALIENKSVLNLTQVCQLHLKPIAQKIYIYHSTMKYPFGLFKV
jgi:hypothetical protein